MSVSSLGPPKGSLQQQFDRIDSLIDWTIDGTHCAVRSRASSCRSQSHSSCCAHKASSQQPVERNNSGDNWTIDKTCLPVWRVMTCVGAKPMLLLAWRRDLGANFFAGTIPETIAEMTALRRVYVVDCFAFRLAHFSCFAQDPAQQQSDRTDPIDNWKIDVARLLVCCCWLTFHRRAHTDFSRRVTYNNRLVGPIPTEIGQLTALTVLYVVNFDSNDLTSLLLWHAGAFRTTS
jgi:hypothetical protein